MKERKNNRHFQKVGHTDSRNNMWRTAAMTAKQKHVASAHLPLNKTGMCLVKLVSVLRKQLP